MSLGSFAKEVKLKAMQLADVDVDKQNPFKHLQEVPMDCIEALLLCKQ